MNPTLQKEILDTLGIYDLPEEQQNDILERITDLVMHDIITSAVERLPADTIDDYTNLIDTNPEPDAVFTFFEQHVPDFDTVVHSAVTSVAEVFRK